MEFKNEIAGAMPTDKDMLKYVDSELDIQPERTNGAEKISLHNTTFKAETPFKVWYFELEDGSNAHLHFKNKAKKPFKLVDLTISDSTLYLSSDVDIDMEEVSGYKSLDIIVCGNSTAHIDLRNFDLDSVYLCLNNLSESAKVRIFVKDGTKLWVNTKGRVGAYQLRIDGLPKMEVTSM
jgi:hypothetical protein